MNINPDELTVTDNTAESRYQIQVGAYVAFAAYHLNSGGDTITFTHTEVPKELEGGGVGGKLARFALDDSRARGRTVIPECPFIAAYIRRHPEYQDLVYASHTPHIQS
ncbi:MAG: N-acetyltransferase [Ktedonobacterales bacterium]|nr:N-acetyltransferase [Ktedonobacterales bacterium]